MTVNPDEYELDFEVFDRIMDEKGFTNDTQRAKAIGMHYSSLSKLRAGAFRPGRKFILGTASIGIPLSAIFRKRRLTS